MKKASKVETARICVTLPVDMLQNFRLLSEETDLSVSRLIYLRLRKREPILIVTDDMLREIQILRELLNEIKFFSNLSPEKLSRLESSVNLIEKMVNFDSPTTVVHVKRR